MASYIRKPVYDLIDTFVEMFPGEDYGFAHIVLADYNLEDSHIDFCLHQIDDMPHRSETVAFLVFLKALPEAMREMEENED